MPFILVLTSFAMQADTRTIRRQGGIVIPDCCNIGVVFRVLLAVNMVAVIANLLQSESVGQGVRQFVEASMVIELTCLWSLFALCGLRQLVLRLGFEERMPQWGQRLAATLVPALITGLVIYFFSSVEWLAGSFSHAAVFKGVFIAALASAVLQHYFSLRLQAYSPVLIEARLQALQARIRPHFLFNSLNAVLSLIRTEPRRAETTLEDLADLFRVLMCDPRNMTTLENELHLCRQYLSIEKIRLGERLQVDWAIDSISDDVLRKAQLPVLLLQPLIENAVHHGVEPASMPVTLHIRLSQSLDRIEIVVVNPYHGADAAPTGNHMALENVRERLALLYDVEAQLTTAVSNGFFEVRMRFPYSKVSR